MRIGVITDIHSNAVALKEVLKEFVNRKIDKIICCGDIIGIGPWPEETVQMLIQNKEKLIVVKGNHEDYLLKGLPEKVHNEKRSMGLEEIENHKWTHNQLSEKSKEFIKDLPTYRKLCVGSKTIYIVHYPKSENGEYKKHIKSPTIEENEEMFCEIEADIFLYGHTHTTSVMSKNDKWYINPGSLGCSALNNVASCGILTIDETNIEFESLTVQYNKDSVIRQIKEMKYPFYEKILKIFFGV